MDKYVAFLDILGFKKRLKQLGQESAKRYIGDFSSTAYRVWTQLKTSNVEGYIVSDSFILNTRNVSVQALEELLEIIKAICKNEFLDNKILLRGAIAKGKFDKMPAIELDSLSKGLIVGQAYVDAYTLEDSAKIAGLILTQDVYEDIKAYDISFECSEEKNTNGINYVMIYLDYNFLINQNNLSIFVSLAAEANWLPHYYNTLYYALKKNSNLKEINILFDNIISCIGNPSERWRDIDTFINNAFNEDVMTAFQTRFLRYIRERVVQNIAGFSTAGQIPRSEDRVLDFIKEHNNVTLSQISAVLDLSKDSTSRILKRLMDKKVITSVQNEVSLEGKLTRKERAYSINK